MKALVKSNIESFLDILRKVKEKTGIKGEPPTTLLLAPEVKAFSGFSDDDKRRVFGEFKDKI